MKVRIVKVDMNGYLGREHHPMREDEGKVIRVVAIEVGHWTEPGGEYTNLSKAIFGDSMVPRLLAMLADEEHLEQMFVGYTEDGVKLELMSHEVELVSL